MNYLQYGQASDSQGRKQDFGLGKKILILPTHWNQLFALPPP